jgi:hypothetical protein
MATFDDLSPQRADEMRYIHENAGVKDVEERLERVEAALREAGLLEEEEVAEDPETDEVSGQLDLFEQ